MMEYFKIRNKRPYNKRLGPFLCHDLLFCPKKDPIINDSSLLFIDRDLLFYPKKNPIINDSGLLFMGHDFLFRQKKDPIVNNSSI